MQPEVSILIPVYRGEAYIGATLRSLQDQKLTSFEVLCVDDCSDDGSAEIILAHAAESPRVRYLRTDQNLGNVPRILTRYLNEIRGRFFVYSSQDDTFSPDWLSSMIEAAVRTGAEAVVPDLVFYDGERGEYRWLRNSYRAEVSGVEAFLLSLDWSIPSNAMVHRSLFERLEFLQLRNVRGRIYSALLLSALPFGCVCERCIPVLSGQPRCDHAQGVSSDARPDHQ
jgi:glycosyltransferase involved in cell wall biosynthesis